MSAKDEAVPSKGSEKKTFKIRESAPFHSKLSDVGLYSVGGLCAVSLMQLFNEDSHREFKKKALQAILLDLGQPSQTNESMFAIMEGEIMDDGHAFVDAILNEDLLKETRQPLVVDFVTMAISDGCYDSRMRMLIKHIAWQLRVTWDEVEEIEAELAETLEYNTYVMSEEEEKEKAKKSRNRKAKRYALIGLATVGGGALIGLTGGLAAPLVAAGAGAIIGGAGAAALGSAAGVAIIGSLFGVAGAGLTGYKMKRRIGAIEEFSFEPLTLIGSKFDSTRTVKQLHITIAVTGWINSGMKDFRLPWSALAESKEQYSLRWESKYLYQLSEAFEYILQTGISVATTEALKYTVLAGLISAIAWPAALIGAAGAIDNPWHVCTQRATEVGKQLAEVLLAREQGNRPVTLVGFSLGARVIFSCLEELSKRKGGEGLVEDVVLLGAPVSGDAKYWQPLTKVVAGKIVNGYARGDWLLKFLYRTASVTFKVAGLQPIKWDNRRMHNIDLSDIIDGHSDYNKHLDMILKAVGVRTMDELRPRMSKSSTASSTGTDLATTDDNTGSVTDSVAMESVTDSVTTESVTGSATMESVTDSVAMERDADDTNDNDSNTDTVNKLCTTGFNTTDITEEKLDETNKNFDKKTIQKDSEGNVIPVGDAQDTLTVQHVGVDLGKVNVKSQSQMPLPDNDKDINQGLDDGGSDRVLDIVPCEPVSGYSENPANQCDDSASDDEVPADSEKILPQEDEVTLFAESQSQHTAERSEMKKERKPLHRKRPGKLDKIQGQIQTKLQGQFDKIQGKFDELHQKLDPKKQGKQYSVHCSTEFGMEDLHVEVKESETSRGAKSMGGNQSDIVEEETCYFTDSNPNSEEED